MQETSQDTFNVDIVEAVDQTLSLLGGEAKTLVYVHLSINCKMGKQDIPKRLDEFLSEITKILGPGAKLFEEQFVRCLQAKCCTPNAEP
jgi:hypothetical protein